MDNANYQERCVKNLDEIGAVITGGHFVYTSGKHGSAYINKDAIYPYTHLTSCMCNEIAIRFMEEKIDTVIGPALGGIILSQWVAQHLYEITNRVVFSTYAEKVGGEFAVTRGYTKFITNKRTLVVEDVVNTGKSVKSVIDIVRAAGGNIVGVACLCNRGSVTAEKLGVPVFTSLIRVSMEAWGETECPLCAAGIPISTEVGKGREFLARRGQTA